ncbi:hypothetical protein HMPREF3038_00454 [Akkermansia sp. KLE1797]|nr:hypothetical protein HMPREF3038_00454 [Akkermansia sp. KLE1797]
MVCYVSTVKVISSNPAKAGNSFFARGSGRLLGWRPLRFRIGESWAVNFMQPFPVP